MKRILYFIVSVLFLASCSNQEDLSSLKPPTEKKSKLETFSVFGEVHNAMLKEADANFNEPNAETSTKEEALNHVLGFQKKSIQNLILSNQDKQYLEQGIEKHKDLYCTQDLMSKFPQKNSRSLEDETEDITTEDIRDLLKDAYNSGNIDKFEYKAFVQLVDYVVDNAMGKLSNIEFENKVGNLINQWDKKYSDVDFSQLEITEENATSSLKFNAAPKGALGGVVLSVSQSSLQYWDSTNKQTRAVPAFVGADIAGAVWGVCLGCVGAKVTGGNITWKNVAWSAASGAVTGSTGIVGKVGKWLTKYIRK